MLVLVPEPQVCLLVDQVVTFWFHSLVLVLDRAVVVLVSFSVRTVLCWTEDQVASLHHRHRRWHQHLHLRPVRVCLH